MAKITKRTVDALTPKQRPFTVYDDALPGFGVKVQPTGLGSFIVEYRPDGGGRGVAKKRIVLGRVGELTPDEARNMARDHLVAVRKGSDPAAERAAKRKELTISELIDLWEEERPAGRRGKPLAELTRTYMLGRLRAHVEPLIGNRKIGSVTTADINVMIRRVAKGDTAKPVEKSGKKRGRLRVRGGDAAARRTAADLAAVYSYAVDHGLVKINPVIGAKSPSQNQRRDFLRVDEITRLAEVLTEMEAEGVNPGAIAILRLLIITGSRPSEIESLRWSEVDLEHRCLRLQSTKTGHSIRPLSSAAMTILAAQTPVGDSPYVFPASRGDGWNQASKKIWRQACKRAGLINRVRYHARHGVATLSIASGSDIVSVAALIGHKNPRTTLNTYSHVTDQAAQAAERIGQTLDAAMRGKNSDVVDFKSNTK